MIAEAINYAVTRDHVNVINESFGGNPLPDTTEDVIRLFDDAAVRAGVVISSSTGDAGTTSTIGSPATDPKIISVGATTQFQMYAQSNVGLARYFATGWLSDNISSFSSAGYDESGGTVNLVAPGDLSWASCDASTKFADCTSLLNFPAPIEVSGGTSEASPFVAGAAALVIQAYKKTHGNRLPSPALVKQILLSTATDLGTPAQEQGAGLLNTDKAVQLAESIGRAIRTGSTLLASAGQLTHTGLPGSSKSWSVTVTNTGSKAQEVSLHGRTLGPDQNVKTGSVILNDSTSDQLTDYLGDKDNYALVHITVPAGQSRLDFSIADPASDLFLISGPVLALIDPKGRYAANSEPQDISDYGNVDVRTPAAGTWTAVISSAVGASEGFTGKVSWQAVTERYRSFGTVSPSSFSLAPGGSKKITFTAAAPTSAGDSAGSLVINSSLGGPTSIPVIVRSLVNVASGGAFAGVLTGGNGRPGSGGQISYYSFTVPAGTPAITASVRLASDPGVGEPVGAYLVSPDGNVLGSGQNFDTGTTTENSTTTYPTLSASALDPDKGTWTLIVDFSAPTPGTEVTDPFTGRVTFAAAGKETGALPTGATLAPGAAQAIPVTITNTGTAPEDYFLDPRLGTITTMTLAPLDTGGTSGGSNTSTLPLGLDSEAPVYFVPSRSSSITVRQTSTVPAMTDLFPSIGDPDVASVESLIKTGSLCHFNVSAGYTAPGSDLTPGPWTPSPTECGPFAKAAKRGKATDTVTIRSRAFDAAMTVQTGDLMQLANGPGAFTKVSAHLVELAPGKSVTVNLTIKPSGKAGTVVRGTLYLDDLATGVPPNNSVGVAEVAALPYSYTIG